MAWSAALEAAGPLLEPLAPGSSPPPRAAAEMCGLSAVLSRTPQFFWKWVCCSSYWRWQLAGLP